MEKKVLLLLSSWYEANQRIAEGVLNYTRLNHPWRLSLQMYKPTREDWQTFLTTYDGFILQCPWNLQLPEHNAVLIDDFTTQRDDIPVINSDDENIGKSAAEYLISKGFTSFAFIHSKEPRTWSLNREKSFSGILHRHGKPCAVLPSNGNLTTFLSKLKRGTAIFAAHDIRAMDILNAAANLKLEIPGDFALLGTDNTRLLCECSLPRLSSITTDLTGAGEMAAKALDDILNGHNPPLRQTYACGNVVERESTRNLSAESKTVSICRSLIDTRATQGLTIDDLLNAANCSRRKLEIDFKKAGLESPHELIMSARVSVAKDLINSTSFSLEEIAERTGFSSAFHLSTAFRRKLGITPGSIRR